MSTNNTTTTEFHSKKSTYAAIAIVGMMFFIFGFVSWINAILIPYFRIACELTNFQSYLVTFAFYIAYLVMSVPASYVLKRFGFKKGIMYGFFCMATGALLFVPAAFMRTYFIFLMGLFAIGTGLTILQAAANPYITIIGPIESAAKRISIMGICNKFAGIIAPLLFAFLVIRPEDKQIMESIEQGLLSGEALQEALNEMIRGVIVPYVVLAILLFLFGILFYKSPIQDINPDKDNRTTGSQNDRKSIWSYPYLILGVAALFAHLGSQQISVSTIIGYAQGMGMSLDAAQIFPSCTLGCILLGYLGGVILIPRYISQQQSLVICTIAGLVLSTLVLILPPRASIWSLVLLGVPNSLIYAGIWPLAIRGLGRFTSLGSSLLVMALCGNAVLSLLYGLISDHMSLQASYWLLIPCFVYMIFYAIYGYKIEKW